MDMNDLSRRIAQLLEQSDRVLATKRSRQRGAAYVNAGVLAGLRASVLCFISMLYGKEHSHYTEFDGATNSTGFSSAEKGHAILEAIQDEIDGGWIFSFKKLVSAEIFADFIEMAKHLLEQGYKDPAAVLIGSTLEENLRQLCNSNEIAIEIEKEDGSLMPKKADRLNSDLAKADVYTKLDQKAVTMWLDLRNKAAHGKYDEYTKDQVLFMLQGVTEFLARVGR